MMKQGKMGHAPNPKALARGAGILVTRQGRKAMEEGNYAAAAEHFRQALMLQGGLSPHHPNLAALNKNLAGALMFQASREVQENCGAVLALSRFEEARVRFRQAVEIQDKNQVAFAPAERIKTRYLLGSVCNVLGLLQESEGERLVAEDLFEKALPHDDPEREKLRAALTRWETEVVSLKNSRRVFAQEEAKRPMRGPCSRLSRGGEGFEIGG